MSLLFESSVFREESEVSERNNLGFLSESSDLSVGSHSVLDEGSVFGQCLLQ